LRILTFTTLFPNAHQPVLAVFNYQRTAHLAQLPQNELQVVAPLPYAPTWTPVSRWRQAALIPKQERIGEIDVFHPRYFLLPKISMPLHGISIFAGCRSFIRKLHEKDHFDCIDAHFVYPDGFAACFLGKMLGIPVVVSARGTDMTLYPSFAAIRPQIRWTLRHAAGLIAVSSSLQQEMIRLGAPPQKIRVITNGVDAARFGPEDRRAARQKLGLPESAQIVVSVGSLLPVKCHERLISAVAALREHHPGLKAYIVGEGPARARLEAAIREARATDQIFLVGSRPNEELRYWFNAADVSSLASSREGWPNVLSESIACGTPVVATRVGGVPEIISSPELGIVVDPDPQAMADGLTRALTRQWDRDALVRHARSRTWNVVAQEVNGYLQECVSGAREHQSR
jgi:teichuronic acid biosynthesis glycosyltransferase TuaC